jgi:hypothetical protein
MILKTIVKELKSVLNESRREGSFARCDIIWLGSHEKNAHDSSPCWMRW